MKEALGLVETRGLSNAILVADAMSKTANIKILDLENSRGLGYMTVKIAGDVGAVNAAVTCGKQIAIENNSFVAAKVIPRPSESVDATFCHLNNKKDDIPKQNSIETHDLTEGEEVKEEKDEPLKKFINTAESLEGKVEESKDELEKTQIDQINSEIKDSSNDKSKTKRSGRKKSEPKKKEE